jgi:hypothetical protein
MARAEIPLYHRASIFVNSFFAQNFFFFNPEIWLDKQLPMCYTIIDPREGDLSRLEKTLKKLKKRLDKPNHPWYNKNVPRERK